MPRITNKVSSNSWSSCALLLSVLVDDSVRFELLNVRERAWDVRGICSSVSTATGLQVHPPPGRDPGGARACFTTKRDKRQETEVSTSGDSFSSLSQVSDKSWQHASLHPSHLYRLVRVWNLVPHTKGPINRIMIKTKNTQSFCRKTWRL